jgi:hypothetical protein
LNPVFAMFSEVSIANLYFPPLLIYLGVSVLAYTLIENLTRRWLDWAWHPALARFFVSLIVLSTMVVNC